MNVLAVLVLGSAVVASLIFARRQRARERGRGRHEADELALRLHPGQLLMLRAAAGGHDRGTIVRVIAVSGRPARTALVEALEAVGLDFRPTGARLTVERDDLAASLPEMRTGPT